MANVEIEGDGGPSPEVADRIARLSPAQREALDRMLASVAESRTRPDEQPHTPTEEQLVRIWCDVLAVEHVGVHANFFALGGDSISSLRISARAAAAGLHVTSRQVLEEETIARLARVATPRSEVVTATDEPTGDTVLTPIQRWFFEQELPDSHHWDQAVFVEIRTEPDDQVLRTALAAVVDHHDVLRSRFVRDRGEWRQEVRPAAPDPAFAVVDLAGLESGAMRDAMRAGTLAAQARIDLGAGPLVSATLFRSGTAQPDRLLLAVHHLVVDGVSMRVLLEDLQDAYRDILAGRRPRLPERTLSFRAWSRRLAQHAHSPAVRGELPYWRGVPQAELAALPMRRDPIPGNAVNKVSRARTVSATVPAEVVSDLKGTRLRDVLVTALLLALRTATGREGLQLDLEGHGREPLGEVLDVTRTVGWFTSMYPVVLRLPAPTAGWSAVRAVARQLDAVPRNGIGYGLLRYLADGDDLAGLPPSQLSFNYLGWFDSGRRGDGLLGSPLQVPGPLQSGDAERRHLAEVVITGIDGRLLVELTFADDFFHRDDMEALVSGLVAQVRELAGEHREEEPPADGSREFPLMRVDARQMSVIAAQLDS